MQLTQLKVAHTRTHPPPLVVILFIISILFTQAQLRVPTILEDCPPESGDIVSGELAMDEHDGGAEGEEVVEGLLQHLLQQHHLLLFFLPYLKVVMVMVVISNHHLV